MNVYSHITSNKIKTYVVIGMFMVFATGFAYVWGKAFTDDFSILALTGFALIFSGLMSFGSYYYSDKMILSMSSAHKIKRGDNPRLYKTVENLCIGSGLPLPAIYTINDTALNAFATGRDPNHAVICVTTGLLEKLSNSELEGVIAHELSHIGNYDIRLMSIVVILVGVVALLADIFLRSIWYSGGRKSRNSQASTVFLLVGIALAIISPLIASLIHLAISRKREFLADASAALLTRYPEGLASALEKIGKDREPLEAANNATAHLYIANPLIDKRGIHNWFAGLFNTHPPISERIKILRSM
ncbi:MAG: zinc metalloprotease HtpX [Candidatus Levybacteria bacterium RIFCSPHIGHO2_02_FULL_42_12]|nr:MAG: zinc metalloprotease HtpX [Candidatus Levybacteria bacterium RIFCSPHIGHO2_01_FULL_42_15]OGH31576.1 MAG: zinc metalloprotease HtpX [Candidatus Levybacteria bacterium RIFCSPHIGHO2_02_FULL_42_12]OGH42654.1 MAG: zinc metalloprotease HtpX [Candidatus Levybacteria bacterium RIFCSPLOWO2_01_FULL_42_15]